jgi:hypothetical protein
MKITKLALSAAIAAACLGGSAIAQAPAQPSSNDYGYYDSEPAPVMTGAQARAEYSSVIPAACACGDSPVSSCDLGGCDSGGCDGLGGAGGDDPWKLFQNPILGFDIGGWTQVGYHTYNNTLFNQHGDNVNLHQAWLYAERIADGSDGLGFGGRIDYVYGVDAQDTQAFGMTNNSWDNGWDNGIYGNALPQVYGEAAYGDLSVKFGHFFTLIGYEVVAAPGNFFFSHSYTMYNSEPFTHTGVLAQYNAGDNLTLYGGWVSGWDSGFENNGSSFLGGSSVQLTDKINYTSQYVIGRFGAGPNNEVGFMSSQIATVSLTDAITYVLWMDYLDSDNSTPRAVERESFDINQYLLVSLNDYLTWGTRFEWYNLETNEPGGASTRIYEDAGAVGINRSDIYVLTTGVNIRAGSNLLFRPEVRWDWSPDPLSRPDGGAPLLEIGSGQTTFGTDMIFTF